MADTTGSMTARMEKADQRFEAFGETQAYRRRNEYSEYLSGGGSY